MLFYKHFIDSNVTQDHSIYIYVTQYINSININDIIKNNSVLIISI